MWPSGRDTPRLTPPTEGSLFDSPTSVSEAPSLDPRHPWTDPKE